MNNVGKHKILRVLKWLGFTFLGLFAVFNVVVVFGSAWLFLHPQDGWALIEKYVLPSDLKISWEKMEFHPHKNSIFNWDVDWKVEGLSIKKLAPRVDVTIDTLHIRLNAIVFAPGLKVTIHDVTALASRPIILKFPKSNEPGQKSYYQQVHTLFSSMSSLKHFGLVEALKVSVAELRWLDEKDEALVVGFGIIKLANEDDRLRIHLHAANLLAQVHALDFSAEVDMAKVKSAAPFVTGLLTLGGPSLKNQSKIFLTFDEDELDARVEGEVAYRLNKDKLIAKPHLFVSLAANLLRINLNTSVMNLPGPIKNVDSIKAMVEIPQENGATWSRASSKIKIDSAMKLFFIDKNMRQPFEKECRCRLPEEIAVKLDGDVWLKNVIEKNRGRQPVADIRLQFEGIKNRLFNVNLTSRLKVDQEEKEWIYEPSVDGKIEILSYQGVRRFLDAKGVMIPSPFDVLEGTANLTATGPIAMRTITKDVAEYSSPIDIALDLKSKQQKIAVRSQIGVNVDSRFKSVKVDAAVTIDDFQIELPPLDPIAGLPRFRRDQRLISAPPKPKKPPTFKVAINLDLETAHPGAIRLLSGLAHPNIPVSLKLRQMSGGGNNGFVKVEPFQIKYLRRTVSVEKMSIDLMERKDEEFPIDGRLRIDQTDYKVFIDIRGTTANPQFQLSSEPYLNRNDIISVLLYDRVTEQLVSSDAETSAGVEAAMADRAIGLFGIWAFATTPIRSFSYNAVTKVYTATVQLADGLTAGIGTDWEHAAHLEVRKRVSKQWVLTASWSPAEDQTQVGSVVLQWEKRF